MMSSSEKEKKEIVLAVLPFNKSSGNERATLYLKGFEDDLRTHLSKFTGLSVLSSFSTEQVDPKSGLAAFNQLKVDYLISGTALVIGEQIRLSLQLSKVSDGKVLYAHAYQLSVEEILSTQNEVIAALITLFKEHIDQHILTDSYTKNTTELKAYEQYLLGVQSLKKGTAMSDKQARSYFHAALEIEPNYALAYTGLSQSYFNYWSCILWDKWDESMQGAHKYAVKAVELDPGDYQALGILGRTYMFKGRFQKAEHYIRTSLRINSNDASHLLTVSYSLVYLGHAQEALDLYYKAIKINPLHPSVYYAYGSNYLLEAGQFQESVDLSKKVDFDCWTDFPAWVAAAYYQLGNLEETRRCWFIFLKQYEDHVYSGSGELEKQAADWLYIINPFRGKSYLDPLYEYITQLPVRLFTQVVDPTPLASFLRAGKNWKLKYKGLEVLLPDTKGLTDLQKLLSTPEEQLHCTQLMQSAIEREKGIEILDRQTREESIRRIKELQEEIEYAESINQTAALEPLQKEHDKLISYLSAALGIKGKSRSTHSITEKARTAVTWRIRSTIKKITEVHPVLGKHLQQSIKTGVFCVYSPETPIDWELNIGEF